MPYNDSSKGMIINANDEVFSYDLDMDNFTFTKKKYNFLKIFDKFMEIIGKYRNLHDDTHKSLKRCLKACLLSDGNKIEIYEFGDLSLENNIIIFEYISMGGSEITELDVNDFIIDETVICLDV